MKKQYYLFILVLLILIFTIAPTKAYYSKERAADYCTEQGYTYNADNESCIFSDGNSCLAYYFFSQLCGQEYVKELPCRTAGEQRSAATWCCAGLELDELRPYEIDQDGECNPLGEEVFSTCSECGNGICESWENYCNCRADCKKAGDLELIEKVRGQILLQVEEKGEAWYVNPDDKQRYYMGDGDSAYGVMRTLSLGISNQNINKIPIGIIEDYENIVDSDGDGLDDKLEEAIGTDPENDDTDEDGFSDKIEVINGFNPLGLGQITSDTQLIDRLKGKILLQVEGQGEAWYLNPDDSKRYYLKDGETAYQIMSRFGLGITNENLYPINRGSIYLPFHDKLKSVTVNDNFSFSYPLGWAYVIPGGFGDEVKIMNANRREVYFYWPDNYGQNIGYEIYIIINQETLGVSEYTDNLILEKFDRIKTCEYGEAGIIEIDNLNFYKCNEPYYGFDLVRIIDDVYFFIGASYGDSDTIDTIEKVLSTIDFLDK